MVKQEMLFVLKSREIPFFLFSRSNIKLRIYAISWNTEITFNRIKLLKKNAKNFVTVLRREMYIRETLKVKDYGLYKEQLIEHLLISYNLKKDYLRLFTSFITILCVKCHLSFHNSLSKYFNEKTWRCYVKTMIIPITLLIEQC